MTNDPTPEVPAPGEIAGFTVHVWAVTETWNTVFFTHEAKANEVLGVYRAHGMTAYIAENRVLDR